MRRWNWALIVEVSSAFAILAGLVFVGLQMQQEQAISTAELQQELIASRIALSELESSHAELLAKANSESSLSEAEQISLESLVRSHWGWAFFGQRRWEAIDHPALNYPLIGFAQFLKSNPGAMAAWLKIQDEMKIGRARLGIRSETQDRFDSLIDSYLYELMNIAE